MSENISINWEELLAEAITAEFGKQASQIQVDLVIMQRPQMRGLNKQYRSKDTPTDVLSFPLYSHAEIQRELAIQNTKYKIQNTRLFVSTGGGAMLEFFAKKGNLPGLRALNRSSKSSFKINLSNLLK